MVLSALSRFSSSTSANASPAKRARANALSAALSAVSAAAIWTFQLVMARITNMYFHLLPTNAISFSPMALLAAAASFSAACSFSISFTVSSPDAFFNSSLMRAASASASFSAALCPRVASPKASAAAEAACFSALAAATWHFQHVMRCTMAALAQPFIIARIVLSALSLFIASSADTALANASEAILSSSAAVAILIFQLVSVRM